MAYTRNVQSTSESSMAPLQLDEDKDESMFKKRYSFSCLCIFVTALVVAALIAGVSLIVYFTTRPAEETQLATTTPATTVRPDWTADLQYRLPGELIATHYTIFILPNFTHGIPKDFVYHGRTEVHLLVKKATNRVVLHAVQNLIIVNKATVRLHEYDKWLSLNTKTNCMWSIINQDAGITPTDMRYIPQFEYVAFQFDRTLQPGEKYVLRLAWDGPITSALQGFYWSSYVDPKGVRQYLTATHFSSIHARRAFPCLDELDIKATFDMRMLTHVGHNLNTLSNTPRVAEVQCATDGLNYLSDVYDRTVNTSTYLVAYAFSTHKSVNMTDKYGRLHRLWSRPDMVERLTYARDVSAPILYFFEDIFGIMYDYKKLDHFSIPDFSAGAMENWGLITYREERLFYLENVDSVNQKQRVAMIVAHEIAHQWFGNLVTIGWFSDLWITEGFARYLQYVAMNNITAEWNLFLRFHNDVQMAVLRTDSLNTSRPLSYPVGNNVEVRDMFDTITYDKGGSIIHMMRYWIGNDIFWKGLKLYLKRHSYGNSYPEYLAQALEEQAHVEGKDFKVTEVLPTWVYQNGYPVVKMMLVKSNGKTYVRMQQRKFLLNGKKQEQALWKVPVNTWFRNVNKVETHLLQQQTEDFEVLSTSDVDVFVGNYDMTGFYRVNYDTEHWLTLAKTLQEDNFGNITEVDRGALVDNGFALARTGDANYTVILDLTSYLCKDVSYLPWTAAISNLDYLELMAWNVKSEYYAFLEHWRLVIKPVHDKLIEMKDQPGGEPAPITLLRVNAITKACNIDLPSCVDTAKDNFAKWKQDSSYTLDPDLKQNTLCTAIRNGDDADWKFLYDLLAKTDVASERTIYINALACSTNAPKLYNWLNETYAVDGVPTPEFETIYVAITRNIYAKNISRTFFYENWEPLCTKPASTSTQRSIILNMFNTANTAAELAEVRQFYNTNEQKLSYAEAPLRQVIENIEINITFETEYADDIVRWLSGSGSVVDCPAL